MVESFRASDGVTFLCHRYPDSGNLRGRIVMIHGIRSHAGWYERTSQSLAVMGYEVVFMDRRGAGLNQEGRGDCPSFKRLLDDVVELCEQEKAKGGPVYLAGISWGGKIAISIPHRKPGVVDGIILIAPGIVPKVAVPFLTKLKIAATWLIRPKSMFPIPLNEPQLFTASKEWQAFIDNDPHAVKEATARFLANSVRLDLYIWRALRSVVCPVLLLSAGKDQIADADKTREKLRTVKQLKEIRFENTEHTLEFEGIDVAEQIRAWLLKADEIISPIV